MYGLCKRGVILGISAFTPRPALICAVLLPAEDRVANVIESVEESAYIPGSLSRRGA